MLTVCLQLREFYKTVATLKGMSGFTWDDQFGLNIGAQTEQAYNLLKKVIPLYSHYYLLAYTELHWQANHKVKPFKNHGFRHFDAMYEVMPHGSRNTNAFRPSGQTHGVANLAVGHLQRWPSPMGYQ